MRLTPHLVSAARPRGKLYALPEGHGLYLQVTPEGSKRWRFRYRFARLENTISLGVYPKVGLAKARRLHIDARGLLARGVDPSVERRRIRAANTHTFESVARSWLQVLQSKARKRSITGDEHSWIDRKALSLRPTPTLNVIFPPHTHTQSLPVLYAILHKHARRRRIMGKQARDRHGAGGRVLTTRHSALWCPRSRGSTSCRRVR